MMVQDRIIGVMGLYTEERMKDFKEMDLQHLQIIANHIAVAILNDRLQPPISGAISDIPASMMKGDQGGWLKRPYSSWIGSGMSGAGQAASALL